MSFQKRLPKTKHVVNGIITRMTDQREEKQLKRLELARNTTLKDIDNESQRLHVKLNSFAEGNTNAISYFSRSPAEVFADGQVESKLDMQDNTIVFPLERSATDWKARTCCIGNAAVNPESCVHFPCRKFTSYHFMFRELPKWIMDEAESSVTRSKHRRHGHVNGDVNHSNNARRRHAPMLANRQRRRSTSDILKLPAIHFPDGITVKERKLKLMIEKRRHVNKAENKPRDRCVNYGKPTSIRRLRRPARPVVQPVDLKLK